MVWLALACSSEPPHRGDRPGGPWTAPTSTAPDLEALALPDGLDEAFALLLELDVQPLVQAYDRATRGADGYCPAAYGYEYYEGYTTSWYAQCTSYDGTVFSGYASDYREGEYRGLGLEATVLTPGGETLSGNGYWGSYAADYGNTRYRGDYLDGRFEWDGAGSAGAWYSRGIVPSELSIDWSMDGRDHVVSVAVDGQLTGGGGAYDTFDFQELDWSASCGEPRGDLALRTTDDAGAVVWLDVAFSGKDREDGGCDGCGDVSWRGEVLGEVCSDFASLATAVVR